MCAHQSIMHLVITFCSNLFVINRNASPCTQSLGCIYTYFEENSNDLWTWTPGCHIITSMGVGDTTPENIDMGHIYICCQCEWVAYMFLYVSVFVWLLKHHRWQNNHKENLMNFNHVQVSSHTCIIIITLHIFRLKKKISVTPRWTQVLYICMQETPNFNRRSAYKKWGIPFKQYINIVLIKL